MLKIINNVKRQYIEFYLQSLRKFINIRLDKQKMSVNSHISQNPSNIQFYLLSVKKF